MTGQPLTTIITVVFNGEKYLEQTIKSVLDQTYKNIEYIIVDGGSTDGTLGIISSYKEHIAKWVSEPDKGLYDAMNKGIGMAKGEIIGMINSDDWYESNAVETMVKTYIKNPTLNIFHADRYDVDSNGQKKVRKFNRSVFKFKYYGMTYNHPSMFITKKEYLKHTYNTNLKSLSDYQFVMEAFLQNPNNLMYVPKAIVNFRLGGISANSGFISGKVESFKARRSAGLPSIHCIFATFFGLGVNFVLSITRIFNKAK